MSSRLKILCDGSWDGPANMARDEALLDELDELDCVGRIYGWTDAWVSLGRFQRAEKALLKECKVPYVIRPTGGKAVLHGHDITLGLAARLDWLGSPERRITVVYRRLLTPIVNALNEAGVACALGEKTRFVGQSSKSGDCFAHVSPNDIVNPQTGQKVCGCALKITESSVLLQASIPVAHPLVDPTLVFDTPSPVAWSGHLQPSKLRAAIDANFAELGVIEV